VRSNPDGAEGGSFLVKKYIKASTYVKLKECCQFFGGIKDINVRALVFLMLHFRNKRARF
jgi:hypothetical protein